MAAVGSTIGVRMRPGLLVEPLWTRQGRLWVLSDPLVREYHYLMDEEYHLLRMLDGRSGFETLRQRFESGDRRRRLDRGRLLAMIARWHRDGLVESLAAGQSRRLASLGAQRRRVRRLQAIANPLAIRLPGFDPRWLLDRMVPALGWLFYPWAVAGSVLLVVAALLLTLVRFDELVQRLPSLGSLASPASLSLIIVVTAVVKLLHELGHAVACRVCGAEPKEVGVLLLMLVPCLYCDVSDAWRLPRLGQRLMISAAGIYVELLLAALAALLWWVTQPGMLNQVCLIVMVLGSVNTLLVNGNPLLRYDGYYLLADALGIVNLWQRSRARLGEIAESWLLGIAAPPPLDEDRFTRRFLVVYGVASGIYRWFVLAAMLWLGYRLLQPLGLGFLVVAAGVWLVVLTLLVPLTRSAAAALAVTRRHRIDRRRPLVAGLLLVSLAMLVVLVPIPNRMTASVMFRPADADPLYVAVPGRLADIHAEVEQPLQAGQPVATLVNRALEIERLRLQGQLRRAEGELEHVAYRGATDAEARAALPTARARVDDLQGQLQQLAEDLRRLEIKAPRDGLLWPVAKAPQATPEGELATWGERPLDQQNLGAYLDTGTHLGSVGAAGRWQAVLYVGQDQIELLRPGLKATLRADHLPGQKFAGSVDQLARINAEGIPPQLADRLAIDLDDRPGQRQQRRPRVYQVEVSIDAEQATLLVDGSGRATIWLPRRTLWQLLSRWVADTFVL